MRTVTYKRISTAHQDIENKIELLNFYIIF